MHSQQLTCPTLLLRTERVPQLYSPVEHLVKACQGVAAEADVADQAVFFQLLEDGQRLLDDLHRGWGFKLRGHT